MTWQVGSHGSGKRHWFVFRDANGQREQALTSGQNIRWFGSQVTAQKYANRLNGHDDGIERIIGDALHDGKITDRDAEIVLGFAEFLSFAGPPIKRDADGNPLPSLDGLTPLDRLIDADRIDLLADALGIRDSEAEQIAAQRRAKREQESDPRCRYRFPLPSWAGEDQMTPCRCDLPKEHDGTHSCQHLREIEIGPSQTVPDFDPEERREP